MTILGDELVTAGLFAQRRNTSTLDRRLRILCVAGVKGWLAHPTGPPVRSIRVPSSFMLDVDLPTAVGTALNERDQIVSSGSPDMLWPTPLKYWRPERR